MKSTPVKRKWPEWSYNDEGQGRSEDLTPYLTAGHGSAMGVSTENPCPTLSSGSVVFRSGSKTPQHTDTSQHSGQTQFRKPSQPASASTSTKSKTTLNTGSKETIINTPKPVRNKKANKHRTPFSRETPRFDRETPILATARHVGSTVQISCSTDAIRQVQDPYSKYIANTTTSENVGNPRSATTTPRSSGSAVRTQSSGRGRVSDISEMEGLSDTDVHTVRDLYQEPDSSLIDSQIYMGMFWHGGKLGVAYYDLDSTLVHVMMDLQETDDFKLMLKVLCEVGPARVVVSAKQDERMLKVLRQYATDKGYNLKDSSSSWLQLLPSIDFSCELCKQRVLSIDLPSIPEHYTHAERTLYFSSLLPPENISMVRALGGLLRYLDKARVGVELEELGTKLLVLDIKPFTLETHMFLDETAYSALQIFKLESHPSVYKAGHSGAGKEGLSLFGIMNRTKSQLGSRRLRTWFQRPLKDRTSIESRQAAIAYLNNPRNMDVATSLETAVKHVKNIAKILRRMVTSGASVGDWKAVYETVYHAASIKEIGSSQPQSIHIFKQVTENFTDDLHQITSIISKIVDFRESCLHSRFVVNPGVDEELDQKKRLFSELPELLSRVAVEELNILGDNITTCSVAYMPQIGYLLAIPEAAVSEGSNVEDEVEGLKFMFASNNMLYYKSSATRDLDYQLGDTRCDITDIETAMMHKLQNVILQHTDMLLKVLDTAAQLDCLLSLASCAREYNYVRPTFTEENVIEIVGGRHPIQELCCGTFMPNDVQSNASYGKVKILTGPNACGKSVYLKQVGLIVFLAQVGSFVPAEEARLGLVDKIYTRIHTLESVSVGLSTFMIDLNQMSEAIRDAGPRSLCIVDEFGKGTDQVSGVSLLCACIKYWVGQGDQCPHVFVSTHFHSIINQQLLPRSPAIKFLTLECMHDGQELVFLYQLVEGHTTSSYACHVASQAGLPDDIVHRGAEVIELLRQGQAVRRVDDVSTDKYHTRCEVIVNKFMNLDLETADIRAFLDTFVLPTIDGKL